MLQNPTLSTSEVIERTVSNLPKCSNVFTPKLSTLKRSLYRYHKSAYQSQEPMSLADISVPEIYRKTFDDDKFLQYDSEDNRRIMIFATQENIKVNLKTLLALNRLDLS